MLGVVELKAQVALACRILAMHGHTDLTLGHVSARGPKDIIYVKRNYIGLDEVTPEDIIGVDMDGNRVEGTGEVHLETVLHIETYRRREDVQAVSHTHPPYAIALGATDASLSFLNHDSLLFFEGLGYFEETAGLIINAKMGEAVAAALGQRKVVLMRNHGVLVVGKTVPWLTYTNLTLERAIKIQSIATGLGNLSPLSQEMAAKIAEEKYRDEFVDIYWRYLKSKLDRRERDNNFSSYEENKEL